MIETNVQVYFILYYIGYTYILQTFGSEFLVRPAKSVMDEHCVFIYVNAYLLMDEVPKLLLPGVLVFQTKGGNSLVFHLSCTALFFQNFFFLRLILLFEKEKNEMGQEKEFSNFVELNWTIST